MKARENSPLITTAVIVIATMLSLATGGAQTKVPKALAPYIAANKEYKGEVGRVIPPEKIKEYIDEVKAAAAKNKEWFKEYSAKAKPGIPLPYHENLGLTPKRYKEYRELWNQREFKVVQKVGVKLEQVGDKWRILVSGAGARISLLRYDPKKDVIVSTNGELKRIDDIDASAETILGAWKGSEWKFEEETGLGRTKENFAIGKSGDEKYGLLVYRLQEVSSENRVLFDRSMVIRFALK